MKGLEERKARIDADVMERYKARCIKCVNVASDGYGLYFCRFNKTGNYVAVMTSGVMKEDCKHYKRKVQEAMLDFCQVCRHYDIVGNKCSKAPKRAIPKSRCADYEGNTYRDLCKYCSHNNYGICTVQGNKCGVEPFLVNICRYFENKEVMDKKMEYEKKEMLCARCANQCKADGEMDYCDKFVDKEEAARIANAEKIEEIRKRCKEFMGGLVTDFPEIMLSDWAVIKEESEKVFDFNRRKQSADVYKEPFIKFTLTFKVYKKD